MKTNKLLVVSVILFLTGSLIISCTEDSVKNITVYQAMDYYPLAIGKYITYKTDSIHYFETIANDTVHVDIKEVLTDTFRDGSNFLNYRIERFSRPSGTDSWTLVGTGTANYKDVSVEKVENNLRYIKLVSPVEKDVEWKGHAYLGGLSSILVDQQCNNLVFLEGWEFCYTKVREPELVGVFNFEDVITVVQNGSQNLIELNHSEEKYAKGVGMVYRFFRHYTTQNICPDCIWEENTQCGYSVRMTVIDYN
ncbi:MAG: hypothetical protein WAU21_11655 [Chitinophagales bacterium]|nr:hypothetical protein [Bacteroidota bacterium]MBK8682729.1 hypothetical protein [Bacteroidota bacterium]